MKTVMNKLDKTKAQGSDEINPHVLKECYQELSYPIWKLIKISLEKEELPVYWNQANITPIYKKGDKTKALNYRPIALTSCVCKIMEKILHKKILKFFQDNQIINPCQSGFVLGDSTAYQLIDLYHHI